MARGDHIKVRRMGGLYSHHGIDMGDGTIIHFCGEPLRVEDARVCRVPMEEFLQGGEPIIVSYEGDEQCEEAVVAMAEAQLGRRGYDVVMNNCEHFVYHCKTGIRRSLQVERATKRIAGFALSAAVMSATAAGVLLRHKLQRRW